jgi:signal peptidase I
VIALAVFGCQRQTLVSSSMSPTIKPGEKVTVDYSAYLVATPKRWDVVAFEPPGVTNQVWLMRIVGLPGESVAFIEGALAVNGQALILPPRLTNVTYLPLGRLGQRSALISPYVVPSNSYFVLGDNSSNANDSRFWGAVPMTNLLGRVRNK